MSTRSLRSILLFAITVTTTVLAEGTDGQILLSAGDISVTRQDFQQRLLLLSKEERAQTLANPTMIKDFLQRLYQVKRMAAAAEQLKLDQDAVIQARLAVQRQQILLEALRENTRTQIPPPDFTALAREHYVARQAEFQVPDQYKAAHILKKAECACERAAKRQAIEQLRNRILAGEDFATLAKTESEDTGSAVKGGDLERWMKREDLVPPFADALAKLKIGQLSDVVETQYGFHLIKKLDDQPAHLQSFEEAREKIERELRQNYFENQLAQRALAYRPPAEAKLNEAAVQALVAGQ